jgi:hypothetical protein
LLKTRTEIIDGRPVLIPGHDTRLTHRSCKKEPRRTRVAKKWCGVKVPKMELMTLRKQQRDALKNFVVAGPDPSKAYFEIRFTVRDSKNSAHDFRWRLQPRGPVFRDFLVAVGGKVGPDGSVAALADASGKP